MPDAPTLVAGVDVGGTKTLAVAVDPALEAAAGMPWPVVLDAADGGAAATGVPGIVATVRRPTGVGGGDGLLRLDVRRPRRAGRGGRHDRRRVRGRRRGRPRTGRPRRRAPSATPSTSASATTPVRARRPRRRALADAPVVVDNDVNLAAVGAAVALGCPGDLAYLSVGTGLAAGLRARRPHPPRRPRGRRRDRPPARRPARPAVRVRAAGLPRGRGLGHRHRRPLAVGRRRRHRRRRRCWPRPPPATRAPPRCWPRSAATWPARWRCWPRPSTPRSSCWAAGWPRRGPGCSTPSRTPCGRRAARSPVLAAIDLADRVALVPGASPPARWAPRPRRPQLRLPEAIHDPQVTGPGAVASDTT